MRAQQHLNLTKRLLFKMPQLFSEAELAPVAKGVISNHLDTTVLNLARFWSVSKTSKNDQVASGKYTFFLEVNNFTGSC